jgi:aldose 1-epimerase
MRLTVLFSILLAIPSLAQNSLSRQGDSYVLENAGKQTVLSLTPSMGNMAREMKVKGQNIFITGTRLLAPWANRLDETAFYANGKKYLFNMGLGNVRGPIPIHGFVGDTPLWQVIDAKADAKAAWITSQLEFFRQPDWMAQFPFAHTIQTTHRLQDGVLEVKTRIFNMSNEPMPVAIGFHPCFHLSDSLRDEWTLSIGARTHWILAATKAATGETQPIEEFMPNPQAVPLKDYELDDVFGDLVRDSAGRAVLSVQGKKQKIELVLGPNYRAAVVYAPRPVPQANPAVPARDPNVVCLEPMAAPTNALNLAHRGLYKELQYIPPGKTWEESFWVRPSGF